MKKEEKDLFKILGRYILLLIVGIIGLKVFYFIFTPLTVLPVYGFLSLFFDTLLIGNKIIAGGTLTIEIIGACVIGSAYSLLLILNLSVPNMKLKKRLYAIGFSFLVLLVINILRILLLSTLFLTGSPYFDITHKLFWYIGSVIFIVGAWFAEVKLFKMKDIPFYTDIRFFIKVLKKAYKKSPKKKKSKKKFVSRKPSKKTYKSKRKKKNK